MNLIIAILTGFLATLTSAGRIVGGVDADIADYPYQLSVRRQGSHDCGASVISDHWALSAAHCTFEVTSLDDLTLQGGSSNRLEGGQIFAIDRFENHPRYDSMTVRFDVSLLHTVEPLVGANIQPIPLDPVDAVYPSGTRAVLTGWGFTSAGGNMATILQAVEIPTIDDATCALAWPDLITEDMLCANEPGRSACNTDSGGPLVAEGRQLGVVSWGALDCRGEKPGVYARVAHPEVRGWITEVTGVE